MKKIVRLTEAQLSQLVKDSVKNVLKEDRQSDIIDKFYEMRDNFGDKAIVDGIVGFLGTNNLQLFINHLENNYGLKNDFEDDELM